MGSGAYFGSREQTAGCSERRIGKRVVALLWCKAVSWKLVMWVLRPDYVLWCVAVDWKVAMWVLPQASLTRHNLRFIHCPGVICENCAQNCPCTTGIQQWGMAQKLMFGGALSLLQSFKGGTNGTPESMVTLWDMGSQFYSKCALMHWTHPPSLRATKYSVPVSWKAVSSVVCAAGVISIVLMLWDPTEYVNICCDTPCWLH